MPFYHIFLRGIHNYLFQHYEAHIGTLPPNASKEVNALNKPLQNSSCAKEKCEDLDMEVRCQDPCCQSYCCLQVSQYNNVRPSKHNAN